MPVFRGIIVILLPVKNALELLARDISGSQRLLWGEADGWVIKEARYQRRSRFNPVTDRPPTLKLVRDGQKRPRRAHKKKQYLTYLLANLLITTLHSRRFFSRQLPAPPITQPCLLPCLSSLAMHFFFLLVVCSSRSIVYRRARTLGVLLDACHWVEGAVFPKPSLSLSRHTNSYCNTLHHQLAPSLGFPGAACVGLTQYTPERPVSSLNTQVL